MSVATLYNKSYRIIHQMLTGGITEKEIIEAIDSGLAVPDRHPDAEDWILAKRSD